MRTLSLTLLAIGLVTAFVPLASADHDHFLVGFDSTTAYGDSVTLKTRLLEPDEDCFANVCPVSNRQVDFYVDGAYVGTDVTNSGGYAYLLLVAPAAWHVGEHAIRAQYDRSSTNVPATVESTLTIVQETTQLAARDGYLEAQLTDDDAEPLVGFAVRFSKVTPAGDHEICTAFTDETGTARCVGATGAGVTPLDESAADYKVTFDATADHLGATDSANLV